MIDTIVEVPFFGKLHIFSLRCSLCKYRKVDVEFAEKKEPVRFELEVDSKKDMKVRVVKSSKATIKIPGIAVVRPGPASHGFITNVEGILNRVVDGIKLAARTARAKQKAERLISLISRAKAGKGSIKLILEDPSGNSAIISRKARKTALSVMA